jgi:sporulation protein YlmC with PRC-barrel domain
MQLELGQHIHSADGKDIGTIKHLILDPASTQVKTLVVERGVFLPEDIEIPLDAVQDKGGGDGLYVVYTAEQVKNLPHFDESRYTALPSEQTRTLPGFPYVGALWPNGYAFPPYATTGFPPPLPVLDDAKTAPAFPEVEELRRRQEEENTVISTGDDVVSQDGEKVGEVHRLTFDSATGRLISLTVRQGWLFHKDWRLPADAIASVDDYVVTLNLDKAHLQTRRDEEHYAPEGGQDNKPVGRR